MSTGAHEKNARELVSTFQGFLYDMRGSMLEAYRPGVLFQILELELAEAKARDDAYLASLSDAERRRILIQRRIEALQRRLDNWWEENMAWRFRADPPYHDEED